MQGIWVDRVAGVRETFQAIHNGNQDVFQAPVLEVIHDGRPEPGSFVGPHPQTQTLALALWRDAQSDINRLVFNLPAFCITDFDP